MGSMFLYFVPVDFCASQREGKMSKTILRNKTYISIILGVPEEVEA